MIGCGRTRFRWKEPGHNPARSWRAMRSPLLRLLGVVVVASSAFLALLRIWQPLPMLRLLLALGAIVVFMVITALVHVRFPPWVTVTEREISRGLDDEAAEVWKYQDIVRFHFATRAVNGSTYLELNLATEDDEEVSILVSPEVSVDELRSFLLSKGVREAGSGGDGTARAAAERGGAGRDRRGRETVPRQG